jgi:YebC/PmpR family DNA-binding regulatory protein
MAGHSKWANIKHRKAVTDSRRGKLFTRISKEIIVAAKLGGGDPDSNPRLRMAMLTARGVSMSNETIKRAIQRGTGELEGVSYEDVRYEGYGPGGVAFIVECTTDKPHRTVAELRATFSKCDGNLGETNSVAWNFVRKGALTLQTTLMEDARIELALEAGADDVRMTDEGAVVHCAVDLLGQCQNVLQSKGILVTEARYDYEPNTMVSVTDAAVVKKLTKLIDMLEENDDVQNVHNNADVDDALLDT